MGQPGSSSLSYGTVVSSVPGVDRGHGVLEINAPGSATFMNAVNRKQEIIMSLPQVTAPASVVCSLNHPSSSARRSAPPVHDHGTRYHEPHPGEFRTCYQGVTITSIAVAVSEQVVALLRPHRHV